MELDTMASALAMVGVVAERETMGGNNVALVVRDDPSFNIPEITIGFDGGEWCVSVGDVDSADGVRFTDSDAETVANVVRWHVLIGRWGTVTAYGPDGMAHFGSLGAWLCGDCNSSPQEQYPAQIVPKGNRQEVTGTRKCSGCGVTLA